MRSLSLIVVVLVDAVVASEAVRAIKKCQNSLSDVI